jgi:amino acid adenylation domain-containing protein
VGLSRDLEALAKREGVTLFVLLLAAWEAFLARATGHRNVALGVPFAGRARAALARTVAYCVNPVVLQGSVSPEASFLSHLADTRERVLEALAHAEMPFAELVRRFAPDRRVDDQPFFRVAFAMQSAPGGPGAAGVALDLDGVRLVHPALTLTSFSLERQAAPFDLTLMAARTEEGLAATLQYDTGILDRDRAARILGRFVASLEHLAGAPEAPLRALPVLSPSERSQVLSEWAVGPATSPTAPSIPAALLRRAVATPRAPALRSDVRSIDYRRLVAMGRAGARRLRAAGVRRGDRVALCLDRSVEMVAAMLAVLEAGAAYVPVEPDLPPGRRDHLLEDVGVTVVVVTESRRAGPGSLAATVMSVMELVESDDDDAADAEASLVDLDVDLEPDDLAYVMYTSGSTGEPKGVCVTHGNVLATLGAPTFADLGPGEVMAQLAPPSFDASTLEIWGPLLNGGCVALLEPGPLSLEEIGRQLRRHGVTVTWLTAGLFSLMIDTDARALDGIRQLLTGGDVVPPAQARRALESAALRLVNGYGPTEATVFSTCHSMTSPDEVEGPVPIGRPIAGRTTYVLDEDLEPVPVGVAGELWVGGAGIARGYHGRPGLTAERFLPDPIAQRPGARMYRTGDRVRWREDGRLDFLGRIDEQLKIRGFRIEPAEVERALAEHPGVDRAIVLAQGGEAASKVLVACWVPRTGCDPTPGDLRSFLAGRLPTPSVPSRFVRVHSLPLTGNGKVDRAALAVPDAPAQAPHRGPTSSPEDPLERALASLWSRVLEVPQVGVHDDFFDLGGHSLKATQLASRLHQVFRVEIPLKDLLVRPTVRGLAEALRARVEASRLERISELFLRVESLSPDEARALLTTQPSPPTARGAG